MAERGRGARAVDLAVVVAAAVAVTLALDVLDLPSTSLFGGLVAGLARGLVGRRRLTVPRPATTAA